MRCVEGVRVGQDRALKAVGRDACGNFMSLSSMTLVRRWLCGRTSEIILDLVKP